MLDMEEGSISMLGVLPYDYYVLVFGVRVRHCVIMFAVFLFSMGSLIEKIGGDMSGLK